MKNVTINPLQLTIPYRENLKIHTLERVIEVVCKYYGVNPADLNKKHTEWSRSARNVALAKRAISYLNPIFSQVDYKIIMDRLGYGKKTKSRHTRNRKEVIKKMQDDPAYNIEITGLKEQITNTVLYDVVKEIEGMLARHPMEMSVTIQSRGEKINLTRGVQ